MIRTEPKMDDAHAAGLFLSGSALNDALGQAVSCASIAALEAYDRAIDHQLHAWTGGLEALDQALLIDPGFALAHAARALVLQSQGRGPEAREALARSQTTGASLTDRERSHIAVIADLLAGRSAAALQAVMVHAASWPGDALVMSTALGAFGLIALSGRVDHDLERLNFVRRLAPHYADDNPWMLTHRAWAHIEAGMADVGLPMVERSLVLRSANGNAAHVMMHGCFERSEPGKALAFVEAWIEQYPDTAMLFGHLHWHAALCEIDLNHVDRAVARMIDIIEPHLAHTLPLVGLTDSSSLLWRLRLQGRSAQSWSQASQFAAARFPNGGNVFAELHLAMLAAGTRDAAALQACSVRLQGLADAGHAGALVALRWADGLACWVMGDNAAATQKIASCLPEAARLGGSHAQRTVIDRTLAWLPA